MKKQSLTHSRLSINTELSKIVIERRRRRDGPRNYRSMSQKRTRVFSSSISDFLAICLFRIIFPSFPEVIINITLCEFQVGNVMICYMCIYCEWDVLHREDGSHMCTTATILFLLVKKVNYKYSNLIFF